MSTVDALSLVWLGPFEFVDIVRRHEIPTEFDSHGVYLWLDTRRKCRSYVGKADTHSIWMRQYAWYLSGISGQSNIPANAEGDGSAWAPNRSNRYVVDTFTNLESYLALVRRAFEYMGCYQVFIAALPNESKAVIRDVERLLLWEVKPFDTKFQKTRPAVPFEVVHDRKPWLHYAARCD